MNMENISPEKFRSSFSAFSNAPDALVDDLLSVSKVVNIPAGTLVYSEGDTCMGIAFVFSGHIRVFKTAESGREITLYVIPPGETCILNASCILSDWPYPANAVASEDSKALLVPSVEFSRLMSEYNEMSNFVFGLLSRRLTGVMELVEEVAFGRMDERLMEYLAERSEDGEVRATHQAIANDLGSSREVVSRLLKGLEHKGEVELSRGMIRIKHG